MKESIIAVLRRLYRNTRIHQRRKQALFKTFGNVVVLMWRETHHIFRQFWISNSLEANSQRTLHLALFKKQDYSAAYCLLNTVK